MPYSENQNTGVRADRTTSVAQVKSASTRGRVGTRRSSAKPCGYGLQSSVVAGLALLVAPLALYRSALCWNVADDDGRLGTTQHDLP